MKKAIFLLTVMIVLALVVTACGKEGDRTEHTSEGNVVDIEEIAEEMQAEDVSDAAEEIDKSQQESTGVSDTENEVESVNQQPEKQETSQKEGSFTAETGNQKPAETAGQSEKQMEQPASIQEESPQEDTGEQQAKEPSPEPAGQAVPTATLNGMISSVGNGEFVIRRADAISSDVMVSEGESAEKISVIYTDNTEFELCTSTDGGITANYSSVSSAELVNGRLVEIKGAYEGNNFVAQKVTIYNFG